MVPIEKIVSSLLPEERILEVKDVFIKKEVFVSRKSWFPLGFQFLFPFISVRLLFTETYLFIDERKELVIEYLLEIPLLLFFGFIFIFLAPGYGIKMPPYMGILFPGAVLFASAFPLFTTLTTGVSVLMIRREHIHQDQRLDNGIIIKGEIPADTHFALGQLANNSDAHIHGFIGGGFFGSAFTRITPVSHPFYFSFIPSDKRLVYNRNLFISILRMVVGEIVGVILLILLFSPGGVLSYIATPTIASAIHSLSFLGIIILLIWFLRHSTRTGDISGRRIQILLLWSVVGVIAFFGLMLLGAYILWLIE